MQDLSHIVRHLTRAAQEREWVGGGFAMRQLQLLDQAAELIVQSAETRCDLSRIQQRRLRQQLENERALRRARESSQ